MQSQTRLTAFLFMCFLLIWLNIAATISGVYGPEEKYNPVKRTTSHEETVASMIIYP